MTAPTLAESTMLAALNVIARGKPECDGCPWDDPCNKCFAAQIAGTIGEMPQFKRWRQNWKITLKRKRRKRGEE